MLTRLKAGARELQFGRPIAHPHSGHAEFYEDDDDLNIFDECPQCRCADAMDASMESGVTRTHRLRAWMTSMESGVIRTHR